MMKTLMTILMMISMMKKTKMMKKKKFLPKSINPLSSKSQKVITNLNNKTNLISRISHNNHIRTSLSTKTIINHKTTVENQITLVENLINSVANPTTTLVANLTTTLVASPMVESLSKENLMVENPTEESHSIREENLSIKVAEIDYDYRFI